MRYIIPALILALLASPAIVTSIAPVRSPESVCCFRYLENLTAEQYNGLRDNAGSPTCCSYTSDPAACSACIEQEITSRAESQAAYEQRQKNDMLRIYSALGALVLIPLLSMLFIFDKIYAWRKGQGFLGGRAKLVAGILLALSVLVIMIIIIP